MNFPGSTSSRALKETLGVIARAVLIVPAFVLACTIVGFVFGIVAARAGLVQGETRSWAPLIGAFCGLVTGIPLGAVFGWRILATRFGVSRKAGWTIAIILLVFIPLGEFVLLRSEQMTGPSPSASRAYIDSVSDDGRVIILTVKQ